MNALKRSLLIDYHITSNEALILEGEIQEDKIQEEVTPLISLQNQLSITEFQTQTIPYENRNLVIEFVRNSCLVKENNIIHDKYVDLGNITNYDTINKKDIATYHLPKTAIVENRYLVFLGFILLILTAIFFFSLKKPTQ